MIDIIPQSIDQYATEHSSEETALLKELAKETYASMDIPQMQVGHLEGAFLRFLVRAIAARRILEIGTFTGYSSLVMAQGLPQEGEIITCDIDPRAVELAKKYWSQSEHGSKIKFRLGPALETIESLAGPFDMVFIDADKENYLNYWNACVPLIRPGGILVVDNVLWGGKVLNPTEATDRAIVEFNDFVRADSRVETTMLTVRDGITVAWKH